MAEQICFVSNCFIYQEVNLYYDVKLNKLYINRFCLPISYVCVLFIYLFIFIRKWNKWEMGYKGMQILKPDKRNRIMPMHTLNKFRFVTGCLSGR